MDDRSVYKLQNRYIERYKNLESLVLELQEKNGPSEKDKYTLKRAEAALKMMEEHYEQCFLKENS